MKLSLLVLTAGSMQGKEIPIKIPQFIIGRDRQCHLRPASPIISNRHCAILVKNGKVFVRDFGSTNGTFVNDTPIKGEIELRDQDALRVGPVAFRVLLQVETPAPKKPVEATDDEAAAALLLALQEEGGEVPANKGVDSEGVPTGSTVFDMQVGTPPEPGAATVAAGAPKEEEKKAAKAAAAKANTADTAAAADSILQKYLKRPRR